MNINFEKSVGLITYVIVWVIIGFIVYVVFMNYPLLVPSHVIFYVLILALFVFFFPLTRTYFEYKTLELLANKGELKNYVDTMLSKTDNAEESLISVRAEIRLIIALTIILLLAIALLELIATKGFDDFAKSILAVFTGAITSIIGFYFGTKATLEGGIANAQSTTPSLASTALTANVDQQSVTAGEKISVTGTLSTIDGRALPNKHIRLEKSVNNGSWIDTSLSPTTDDKGSYKQEVVTEQDDIGKTVQYKVKFTGDASYDKSEKTVTVQIKEKPQSQIDSKP